MRYRESQSQAREKYRKADGSVLTGTFVGNARGFGFVEVEGREEDLFIPEDKTGPKFFPVLLCHLEKYCQLLFLHGNISRVAHQPIMVRTAGAPRER